MWIWTLSELNFCCVFQLFWANLALFCHRIRHIWFEHDRIRSTLSHQSRRLLPSADIVIPIYRDSTAWEAYRSERYKRIAWVILFRWLWSCTVHHTIDSIWSFQRLYKVIEFIRICYGLCCCEWIRYGQRTQFRDIHADVSVQNENKKQNR